ncbi:MAG: aldose 1-epimerase [Eubacteriales bacterium]
MSNSDFYSKNGKVGDIPFIELGYQGEAHSHSIKIAVEQASNMFSYMIDGNETLFYDGELPLTSFAVGNPLLFPFPNRIQDAMYTWNGVTRLQKKDGIPIQLHSMLYDETTFTHDAPVVNDVSASLTTRIRVDENHAIYQGFPFCFLLEFTFTVDENGVSITHRLNNLSDEDMPYGMAYHPYFTKLSGEKDTMIHVPCNYMYEVRTDTEPAFFNKTASGLGMVPNVMPTGNLLEVKDTDSDILNPTPVGDLDLDTVYTSVSPNPTATINYRKQGFTLSISGSDEYQHYVVFTPQGMPYFCIEPQTCSTDAINLYNQGIEHVNLLVCPAKQNVQGVVHYNYTFDK